MEMVARRPGVRPTAWVQQLKSHFPCRSHAAAGPDAHVHWVFPFLQEKLPILFYFWVLAFHQNQNFHPRLHNLKSNSIFSWGGWKSKQKIIFTNIVISEKLHTTMAALFQVTPLFSDDQAFGHIAKPQSCLCYKIQRLNVLMQFIWFWTVICLPELKNKPNCEREWTW